MRKVRKNNARINKFFSKLQKLYLVTHWARYGVAEYRFSGKYTKDGVPLVWSYYDCNNVYNEWHLVPITRITHGSILCWVNSEDCAHRIAKAMNRLCDEEGCSAC